MDLIFIFLMANCIKQFFIIYIFFGEMSIQKFGLLFIWFSFFTDLQELFIHFEYNTLSNIWMQYFTPVLWTVCLLSLW